ncbi:MAG: hypothetical protein ACHQFX_12460 [Chitinophagales bacterium]
MKRIYCCLVLFVSVAIVEKAAAQPSLKLDNSQEQPKWAPADNDNADYYFLPDIDTYYYVPRKQFIYQSGGYWTFSRSLPADHKGYDLYSANKVAVNEAGAYRYFAEHKSKYGSSQSSASVQKEKPSTKNKRSNNSEKTSG